MKREFLLSNIDFYLENQFNYEDMLVFKEYDLLHEIGEIMKKKVNNYGLDTLNSIEKSIWDIHIAKEKQNGLIF
jgi:hypothetical protein